MMGQRVTEAADDETTDDDRMMIDTNRPGIRLRIAAPILVIGWGIAWLRHRMAEAAGD